jgi:NAD(P)H-hydrate epimerase
MCTRAALRTGVGLCTLAAPDDVVDHILGDKAMEAMSAPYAQASSEELLDRFLQASSGKQALAIGPGLPTGPAMKQALLGLLSSSSAPVLLDADALNLLVGETAALHAAVRSGLRAVLTPHPGEAARLLGETTAVVQAERTRSARRLCQLTGAVVVLKGARTVVVAPDGQEQEAAPAAESAGGPVAPLAASAGPLSVSPTGNAGMGSGGMGDVLTGMIGALLASGWPPYDAACAGVYWHGLAGDLLLSRRAPGSVLLAGELIETLDAARKQALEKAQASSGRRGWPLALFC